MPHIRSGRLRALAVTSSERMASLPEVPTLAEAALPGFESRNWVGLFAPKGMQPDAAARLNAEINRIVLTPAMRASFDSIGSEPMTGTVQHWQNYVRNEVIKWAKVIREANIVAQ